MKSKIVQKIQALLVGMPDTLDVRVLEARRGAIIEIANECKKTSLYKRTEGARALFYRPLMAVPREKQILMSWVHFLDRLSKAPTPMHMEGAAVLCFPILGDLLKKK